MDERYIPKHLEPSISPEEKVALVKLMEEASEVIQCVSKILMWGWESTDPRLPQGTAITNYVHLNKELDDFGHACNRLWALRHPEYTVYDYVGPKRS